MIKRRSAKTIAVTFLSVAILFCYSYSHGSGFAVYTQGGSALGQGNAVIAHTDDPSAIFFNPALINSLDGTEISMGTTLLFPSSRFKSDLTGRSDKTESNVFYPATLYVTHKVNDKLSAGLGLFSPFGLGTEWPDDWEGRYIAINSELITLNLNPVISYRATPTLTVAAGLDVLYLDATLERKINLSSFALSDADQKYEGSGYGTGFNLGLLYEPNNDISIGASYRSGIDVDIDGEATFYLPAGTPSFISSLFPNTDGDAGLDLPAQFFAGIYYKGLEPLTLEVGLKWEGWSSYEELKINFDKPVLGSMVSVTPKKWDDVYSLTLGAQYRLNEMVTLLTGYSYEGNPVPSDTFEPAVPNADSHFFAIGTIISYRNLLVNMTYGYHLYEDRNKNNSVDDNISDGVFNTAASANGRYRSDNHIVSTSLTYSF